MQTKKKYALNALLARMRYITRWGLMRSARAENLSEHTADAAMLAHMLGLLAPQCSGEAVRAETLAVAALYHDASEILTGDMPTPVKYKNDTLRTAYKALEKSATETLASLAPEPLQSTMHGYLCGEVLTQKEKQLLKAADRLSALIKCIEEEQSGNKEFAGAKHQQEQALHAMQCPEAEYFIEHMLPCYHSTLDELSAEY